MICLNMNESVLKINYYNLKYKFSYCSSRAYIFQYKSNAYTLLYSCKIYICKMSVKAILN